MESPVNDYCNLIESSIRKLKEELHPCGFEVETNLSKLNVQFSLIYYGVSNEPHIYCDVLYYNAFFDADLSFGFIANNNSMLNVDVIKFEDIQYLLEALALCFSTCYLLTEDNGYPLYSINCGNLFSLKLSESREIDFPNFNQLGSLGEQVKDILQFLFNKLKNNEITRECIAPYEELYKKIREGSIKEVPSNLLKTFNNYIREKNISDFNKSSNTTMNEIHYF